MTKRKTTIFSLIIVIIMTITSSLLILPTIKASKKVDRINLCQNILRQWGQIFNMYTSESSGNLFPSTHIVNTTTVDFPEDANCLEILGIPQFDYIYPDYSTDPFIALCPSNQKYSDNRTDFYSGEIFDKKDAHDHYVRNLNYYYSCWNFDRLDKEPLITKDKLEYIPIEFIDDIYINAQFAVALDSFMKLILEKEKQKTPGLGFLEVANDNLFVGEPYGNNGYKTLYRLRKGMERFLITDINNDDVTKVMQSEIWVMMEMYEKTGTSFYFNHMPGGSNVLYADGSTKYVIFSGKPEGIDMDYSSTVPVLPSLASLFGYIHTQRLIARSKLL